MNPEKETVCTRRAFRQMDCQTAEQWPASAFMTPPTLQHVPLATFLSQIAAILGETLFDCLLCKTLQAEVGGLSLGRATFRLLKHP